MFAFVRANRAQSTAITMHVDDYKGYLLYGHSIEQPTGYAASGTVMRDGRVVESSGILEIFASDEEALNAGIAWAREWVDGHA
jgi:hypothetical protein